MRFSSKNRSFLGIFEDEFIPFTRNKFSLDNKTDLIYLFAGDISKYGISKTRLIDPRGTVAKAAAAVVKNAAQSRSVDP